MPYWPEELASYHFNAREVEEITGVPRATQRQWLVRYLDFRQQQFIHHGSPESGTWSWEGVQMIALFGGALRDLHDGSLARRVLMLDPQDKTVRNVLDTFHFDQRKADGSDDLLIVGNLADLDAMPFGTTSASGLPDIIANIFGVPRLYIVNFSAFQRELFEKVTSSVDLDGGPGALPANQRI